MACAVLELSIWCIAMCYATCKRASIRIVVEK